MNRLFAVLLLLGLSGSLRAQENKAPYSMLHVTRASLRFFPSSLTFGGLIPTNGWARGSYRVTCRYQDRVIAERGFTVY